MDSHRCSNCGKDRDEDGVVCNACGAFICASCLKSNGQLCPFCATTLGIL